MFIASTPYLNHKPDTHAISFSQAILLLVSLPILMSLPLGVAAVFILLVLVRVLFSKIPTKKWYVWVMVGIAALLVYLQLGTLVGLQGGMAILLLLAALKSFEGNSRRDWQVSSLVQVFLLTVAVLVDQSLFIGIWVLFCLLLISLSLATLNQVRWQWAWRQSLFGFLLTLLPMIVLFIGMPRKEAPFWGLQQPSQTQSRTGLSDTMHPGSIGDLVQSNELAFSATFTNGFVPQQQDLYWRVMIMAERDNTGTWQAIKGFMDSASPSRQAQKIDYQIVLEDRKGQIPALDYPNGKQQRGVFHELGDVLRVFSRQGVRGISLSSSLSDELPHRLNPSEIHLYTQLNNQANLRTYSLAKQLFQQSGGNTEAYINAVYQYFAKQDFSYTLKPPVLSSENSVDEFLFSSKQGFCEHYADAFVVMMRFMGIPARVVTGYQGGEWNEQGGFWQIRSKDAHAWTEVWLENKRVWKRIDPTAAVSNIRIAVGLDNALPESEIKELVNNSSTWSKFASQSQVYWQRWVVNFDDEQQRNLFGKLGFDGVNGVTIFMVLMGGSIIAFLPILLWWKRVRRHDISPMKDGFLLLKSHVLGNNFPHLAALGAIELKQELNQQERLSADLEQILNEYIQLNYATTQVPNKKIAQAWYQRAKKIARKYKIDK